MSKNPTIVIVHGAWHRPPMYDGLVSIFKSASYDAVVPALPSCNSPDPATATCQKDTDVVRDAILILLDEGKDVLVVAHSYGGIPAGGAAKGLGKGQRKKEGKKGGVIGMVYVSAFVVPENVGLLTVMGGKHAPYVIENQPSEHNALTADPRHNFFNGLSDSEADPLVNQLRPQSLVALDSPAPAAAWADSEFAGRLGFLKLMNDKALPPLFQDRFTEKSGVAWEVRDVEAGHSSFLGKPGEVVQMIGEWAEKWKD
ncbi:MAG: hypothetical protein M1820_004191 [Bogoriella megaspora]|nr:MAG: hypothetical protein M1820_004191 [Bogoriella megaspora]